MHSKTLCLLLLFFPTTCFAQRRTPLDVRPETEEFKQAVENLRGVMKEMQEVAVRFNTGEREEGDKWRAAWNEIYPRADKAFYEMLLAAAKEFAEAPAQKASTANWLFRICSEEVEADRFEGILPVLEILVKDRPEFNEAQRLLGITCFALAEYERGKESIDFLAKQLETPEQMAFIRDNLDDLIAQREREYAKRKKDADPNNPVPRVLIRTTKGDIEVELFENEAPETVGNFISLVESGEYDHKPFGTGMKHFLVQGGGDDFGEPPYTIVSERSKPEARDFYRGTLGMALSGVPPKANSAYAQFFFALMPNPELNKNYTAFGRVVKGLEVMSALTKIDPTKEKKEDEVKEEPDEIIEMTILRKRDHEYKPNKAKSLE
ncbi:MAG: peptidylprolyl isomerase [Planctomycetota bacterium]